MGEHWNQMAQLHFQKEDYSKAAVYAIGALNVTNENGSNQEAITILLKSLMKLTLYSRAIEMIETMLAETPPPVIRAQLHLYRGESYYRLGNYSKAISVLDQLNFQTESKGFETKTAFLKGMAYFRNGDYLKSIQMMQEVPENSRRYPFALYASALGYYHLEHLSEFERILRKLSHRFLKVNNVIPPFKDWVHLVLGEFLLNQDPEEARGVFERISPDSPFFKRVLLDLAWTYIKKEEYVKAIVLFRKLTELYPGTYESQVALLMIGQCYSRLSAYEKAVSHFRYLLDEYSGSMQQIEQEMDLLKEDDHHFISRTIGDFMPPIESWMFLTGDSSGIDLYTVSKAVRDLRELGEEVGGKPQFPGMGSIEKVETYIAETFYRKQMEKLTRQKLNVEELLVRSSLGIARNLSPKDLQVND